MRVTELLKDYEFKVSGNISDAEITNICFDSRKADNGSVFVCIRGAVSDGHDYIDKVAGTVKAVVVQADYGEEETDKLRNEFPDLCILKVDDTRLAMAYMSRAYFDYPDRKLKVIGITGTKGKTTTTYMIRSMLEMAGIRTGLIGTIETIIGEEHIKSLNTTPDAFTLYSYFDRMVKEGIEAVVMEVSSQGLKYNRVLGVEFDYGIFSNLSPDHIGPNEHDDFDDYMNSKAKLFDMCKVGIINIDDEYAPKMVEGRSCSVETFGCGNDPDFKASDIRLVSENGRPGVRYRLSGKLEMDVKVNIPGNFSVYNSLMAVAVGYHFGISEEVIRKSMENLFVKGRVEIVPLKNSAATMIIDYAHNAVSVESLLTTIKEYEPKRLICLFGCGGQRDRNRRYDMGSICAKMSDLCILTTDNPRFEDPSSIMEDILVGVNRENGKYIIIEDRKEAIRYAYDNTGEGDIVLLIGKGHETYQDIKGEKHYFNEREIIEQIDSERTAG